MRKQLRRRAVTAVVAATLAVTLTGCGDDGPSEAEQAEKTRESLEFGRQLRENVTNSSGSAPTVMDCLRGLPALTPGRWDEAAVIRGCSGG